jgi:hypothetical protein
MWRARPDDPVDGVRRQVGRVRARRNGWVVQRALYGAIALFGGAGALLVLTALLASPIVFAAAFVLSVIGLAAAVARVGAAGVRAWVRVPHGAAWVDEHAGLEGRLATLLTLGDRGAPFFRPLLVQTTLARRAAFEPHVVVPSAIPVAALCGALTALVALGVVVWVAPSLAPAPLLVGGIGGGGPAVTPTGGFFRRMIAPVATPADPSERSTEASSNAPVASTGAARDGAGGLANLPGALQASLRRALWGERWARAGGARTDGDATRTVAADDAVARAAGKSGAGDGRDDGRRTTPGDPEEGDTTAAGPGVAGAGTGSDPTLFGPATTDEVVGEGRFALGLAARVRSLETGPRPPTGDAPDAAPDSHPALATRQPPDAPAHRAAVPSAYAAIVRETFAHRAPEEGSHP